MCKKSLNTYMFSCLHFVHSDPSQSDSSAKDFWMDMQAVTVYLKKLSEQNPSASYYNVEVLKYQVIFVLWCCELKILTGMNYHPTPPTKHHIYSDWCVPYRNKPIE